MMNMEDKQGHVDKILIALFVMLILFIIGRALGWW